MPDLKTYDLFISHAWKYDADYDRLMKMLDEAPNFKWRNYSVPDHDPLEAANDVALAAALRKQISPVNIVVILAGMYAAYSKWISKEMNLADEFRKPMLGVKPWGQLRTPDAVTDRVDELVGWNTSSIVSAIRRHAL